MEIHALFHLSFVTEEGHRFCGAGELEERMGGYGEIVIIKQIQQKTVKYFCCLS